MEVLEFCVREGSIQADHAFGLVSTLFFILNGACFYVSLIKDTKTDEQETSRIQAESFSQALALLVNNVTIYTSIKQ
ncbi:cytochrome c biogenesis factor [Siphonobacter sp. SORGH_AS 1065]|nr:cytochrome c biogenesis factor [Siphonobacter sp. SORGH_AS_1065]